MPLQSDVLGRIHWQDPLAAAHLAVALSSVSLSSEIDVVCVGTDRSTGDALGPLVGSNLLSRQEEGLIPAHVRIHGNIHEPVHALNLQETCQKIHEFGRPSTVLAIDACLGRARNIGYITLKQGPLEPGSGVNKKLPSVGDYHLIGVVNVAGYMEHVVLQNTRLSLVIRMADVITEALTLCLGVKQVRTEVALASN